MNCPDCQVEWAGIMVGAAMLKGDPNCWMCGKPGEHGRLRRPDGREIIWGAGAGTFTHPDEPTELTA